MVPKREQLFTATKLGRALGLTAGSLALVMTVSSCTPGQDEPDTVSTSTNDSAGSETDDAAGGETENISEPSVIASDLEAPWSIAFWGQTPLISERDSAQILELSPAGEPRAIGTVDDVAAAGEGGLLGLAVGDAGHLYAYSTHQDGNRIQRFELSGEPGALQLGPAELILDGIPAAGNHNGGRIAFGPDGMLYATTGDAGDRQSAQDVDSLAGKILRMTPGGEVPEDNPFPDSLVYSYGHRNSQGLAWDADGTMYAAEFGQDTWDELNVIEAGGNFGWPTVEGAGGGEEFIDPVQQWEPSGASPSGIEVHDGTIYIANLRGERLHMVPVADPSTSEELFVQEFGRLRDIVAAPDGTLWLLTNNTDGRGEPGPDDDRVLSLSVE